MPAHQAKTDEGEGHLAAQYILMVGKSIVCFGCSISSFGGDWVADYVAVRDRVAAINA